MARRARAMWKASLELGGIGIPVKLYAAVEAREIHFRLLHAEDLVPVRQRMVDPRDERVVRAEEVRRGLEVEEGSFVVLAPEELAAVEPKPSRSIELTRFVPRSAVDPSWYSRPYFLGPDGGQAEYFALVEALQASERCGIARWVLRGSRHSGALVPRQGYLGLIAFHAADEVIAARDLIRPADASISAAERKLAEQLIATLDAPFDPADLRDEYRERVEKLVAAKRKGRRYKVKEAAPARTGGDLADALRRSLRAAGKKRRAAA